MYVELIIKEVEMKIRTKFYDRFHETLQSPLQMKMNKIRVVQQTGDMNDDKIYFDPGWNKLSGRLWRRLGK